MKIDFRYILLVVLSGLGSYWMGGYTMNAIFYITLLLFVAALLQIIFFSIVLKVNMVEPEGRPMAGKPFRLSINLENKGFLGIAHVSSQADDFKDRRIISVKRQDTSYLSYHFRPRVRGIVDVGTIKVGISDLLNILTRWVELEPEEVKVYPDVPAELPDHLNWTTIGEGNQFRSYSKENPYNVRELRRYQPGDSFRKINWKVSAKFNELFVRRGETTEEKDILLILDMNKNILTMDPLGLYENTLVTDALTLSKGLIKEGIPHGFILTDAHQKYFEVTSLVDYQELEDHMVMHKADGNDSLREFIAQKNEFLHERGALIFFTRPIDVDLAACDHLKSDRNQVLVYAPHLKKKGISSKGRRMILRELEGPGYEMV